MEIDKNIWTIKRILRTFDFFGESFTFRYKDEDKHSTVLGGIIFIIFSIITLAYAIYNFIPFVNKEVFSLQYYTMNLNNTEEIKLAESPTAFGVGFSDENKNQSLYNISDLLDIKFKFKNISKNAQNDNKTDINETIDYHPCNTEDFHNLHQKIFEELNISNFKCLSKKDLVSPSGIYTDEVFAYFVISVESKYKDNETHNQLINDYLIANDCKLQFYYTDITININNTKNPFSSFLNSMFLQLNPTLVQKKNIFFMNYHLYDDNEILHINRKEEKPTIKTGLSRVEDYAVFKDLNRTFKKVVDYEVYAKMYIRVDNKRIEIKRRYQDLMEFYADTSALLLSIFWILGIIFAYYDRIKANHSISKKLFYFEGIKKNKFDQFRDFKKFIKANEEMQIDNLEHNVINPIQNSDSKTNETKDIFIRGTRNIEFEEKTGIQKDERIIIKQKTNKEMKKEKKNDDDNNDDLINYTNYNIFEMIGSFKICFCKTKKFENKVNLIKQSRNMIDDKLDIVLYIKNMILFEMINKIYLENKSIINFLSRPIIYLNEDNEDNLKNPDVNSSFESYDEYKRINDKKLGKNEYRTLLYLQGGDFYKSAYRFKPDNLSKNIEKLILKEGQTKIKQKIIYYLKKHLKGVKLNN